MTDALPHPHKLPKDMYYSKKMLAGLGMKYEKIDVCENNCMLFWKENASDTHCRQCKKSRYVVVEDDEGMEVTTGVAVWDRSRRPEGG